MTGMSIGGGGGGELLRAYSWLWSLQQLLQAGVFNILADQIELTVSLFREDHVQILKDSNFVNDANGTRMDETAAALGEVGCMIWLCALAVLCIKPTVWLLCIAQAVSLYLHWSKMPFLWDFELWDVHVELAIILACVVGGLRALTTTSRDAKGHTNKEEETHKGTDIRYGSGGDWVLQSSASSARLAVLLLYWVTVLWKLTTSFFGNVSCGPMFTVSLLDMIAPASFDIETSAMAGHVIYFTSIIAPTLTVVVEAAIPLLLQFAPWQAGVLLGSVFHILIAVTPPPNNASIFSVVCIVKYFFFIPEESVARAATSLPSPVVAAFSVCVTSAAIALGIEHGGDWGCPMSVFVTCVYVHTIFPAQSATEASKPKKKVSIQKSSRFVEATVVLSTLTYALLLPLLGLMDMGATTMFANLYVFSGSNHFFMPTGMLFDYLPELRGGVVRVDNTDSVHFRGLFPHEKTALHSPRMTKWLKYSGHVARQFGPYGARVKGAFAPRPTNLPEAEKTFTPYLIPMVEVRRCLGEAFQIENEFTLNITKLGKPPLAPPHVAREKLSLSFEKGSLTKCMSIMSNASVASSHEAEPAAEEWSACDVHDTELLMQPISWWATKLLGFFSFPIEPGGTSWRELGCVC